MKLSKIRKIKIINLLVNSIKINDLINLVKKKKLRYICISNVHSCVESYRNKKFKKSHNTADLALPDGRPIYWALKLLGSKNATHLPGYYVTDKLCNLANKRNLKIGFYGSTDDNLKKIEINLRNKFKKLKLIYKYSPPFKKLNSKQDKKIISEINKSHIDILFVCLGCPKQEIWMHEHRNNLKCLMVGVGAVADFLSGNKILPNKFFEYIGLAWLIRLISEPRRLFWRYFSTNFIFIILFAFQILGLKKFK